MPQVQQIQLGGGLRSRKVDLKKPFGIYRSTDIPDFDFDQNRVNLNLNTGVDKEEEDEHHLQAALNSNQKGEIPKLQVYIPTPDASALIDNYNLLYDDKWVQPRTLIKYSLPLDDMTLGCLYNVDDKDSTFLNDYNNAKTDDNKLSVLDFETIMWNLERLANEKLTGECPTLTELDNFLKVESPTVLNLKRYFSPIFEWWKVRRYQERKGKQITPFLKFEEYIEVENDPYVCFRRREMKVLRKTRMSDAHSLEKLRKLRDEMIKAKEILELVTRRERVRKELVEHEIKVFEARIKVRSMKKLLGVTTTNNDFEGSPEKTVRRNYRSNRGTGATRIKIPLNRIRGDSNLINYERSSVADLPPIEERIQARREADEKDGYFDFTESPYIQQLPFHPSHEYWSSEIPISFNTAPSTTFSKTTPPLISTEFSNNNDIKYRRRIGRGGRVLLDRYCRRNDDFFPKRKRKSGELEEFGIFEKQEMSDVDQWAFRKWKFDTFEEDIDEVIVELEETARSFNLAPGNEQECRSLMNKPTYPEQVNPVHIQRNNSLQNNTITSSSNSNAMKKKGRSSVEVKANIPIKKKSEQPLNQRDATIKNLLHISQMNALQTQQAPGGTPTANNSMMGSSSSNTLIQTNSPQKNNIQSGFMPHNNPQTQQLQNIANQQQATANRQFFQQFPNQPNFRPTMNQQGQLMMHYPHHPNALLPPTPINATQYAAMVNHQRILNQQRSLAGQAQLQAQMQSFLPATAVGYSQQMPMGFVAGGNGLLTQQQHHLNAAADAMLKDFGGTNGGVEDLLVDLIAPPQDGVGLSNSNIVDFGKTAV